MLENEKGMCHGRFPTDVPCTFPDICIGTIPQGGWYLFLGSQMPDLRRLTIGRLFFFDNPLGKIVWYPFLWGGFALVFCFL